MMIAILSAQVALTSAAMGSELPGSKLLRTHFVYRATLPPGASGPVDLWIPIPSDSGAQTITNLSVQSPAPYRITTEPKYGNRMVYVRIPNGAAGAAVDVSFDVARRSKALAGPNDTPTAPNLKPDRLVPTDGRYAELGVEVAGSARGAKAKMKAIYDHVVATMQYDYKKESPRLGEGDVAFVCDYKKGNCSDLHSYVISLARSQGVPAYLEYGFPISGVPLAEPIAPVGKVGGYHCWTWFYVEGEGWQALDASDGRRWLDSGHASVRDGLFGDLIVERSAVAFSRGRDIDLVPKQTGLPLNNFVYPYAEASGKSAPVQWEVNYHLLSGETGDSQESRINDLLRIVSKQQEEIAALKAGQSSAPPVAVPSKEKITVYGQLRTDVLFDSQQPSPNNQTPFFVKSGSGNDQFSVHPRLTRIGLDFAAPAGTLKGYEVKGKIEFDFQNGGSESRPTPRARLLYVTLTRGQDSWLFGQGWDVISPIFPSPNDDTLMWNVGNLGDRRPQVRYTRTEGKTSLAVAAGLTGAIDAKDLDANGVRDGEDSGEPGWQARLGFADPRWALGIWGFRAREEAGTPVGGATSWQSEGYGFDFLFKVNPTTELRGEWFSGSNLSDFRGGVGQGVNATTGNEIDSAGGWLELGHMLSPKHRIAVGFSEDDPDDADVAAGGRVRNQAWWVHNRFTLGANLEFGVNFLDWRTKFNGPQQGKDRRWNLYISRKF